MGDAINLEQRRILVVEDEALLAMEIVAQIEDYNGIVIGPLASLKAGITALLEERPDAAIVNINLGPDKVYPLAELLLDRDVPFVFASSETRAAIPDRFNHVPLHSKPLDMIKAAVGLIRA